MVGVEEGREFRFRGDLYSQESTFPLVCNELTTANQRTVHVKTVTRTGTPPGRLITIWLAVLPCYNHHHQQHYTVHGAFGQPSFSTDETNRCNKVGPQLKQYGTRVCRHNWHSAGSLGWPFPMLQYKYIFQIKYAEAILSNSTRKLLLFEITKMLIAV